MKPPSQTPEEPWSVNDLNDWVLEAATLVSNEPEAPETVPANAHISAWDETPDTAGHRVEEEPANDEKDVAEKLVAAGNDEADREQRMLATLNLSTFEQR